MARRLTHRIVIETQGLEDDAVARLHVALLTMAAATGHLHDYGSTSLVREYRKATADMALDYRSMPSPTSLRKQ